MTTNKIYPGLIGGLHIQIDLNNTNDKKLYFYGDNREFAGILIVPDSIKEIIYDNDYCTIKNILQLGKNGQIKSQLSKPDLSDINIIYKNANKKNVVIVTEPGDIKRFNAVEILFDNIKAMKLYNTPHLFVKNMHNIKLDFDAHESDIDEDVDNSN